MATVTILGLAYPSPIEQFPVREGPGTNFPELFKVQKGTTDLVLIEVQVDARNTPNQADPTRPYNWFKLRFSDGREGWIRGHVVGLQGDLTAFGFGVVETLTHAFLLKRTMDAVDENLPPKPETPPNLFAGGQTTNPLDNQPETPEQPDTPPNLFAGGQTTNPLDDQPETPEQPDTPPTVPDPTPPEPDTPPIGDPPIGDPQPDPPITRPEPPTLGPPTAVLVYTPGLGTRQGPSTSFDRGFRVEHNQRLTIIGIDPLEVSGRYRWLHIENSSGQRAYVREDFVFYEGDTAQFNLPTDLYPHPMPLAQRSWQRGFHWPKNNNPNSDELAEHNGWDHNAPVGTPVNAGPQGGTVMVSFFCSNCGTQGISVRQRGLDLNDPGVLNDPNWGFGYGHYVIVRYDHDMLPASTQQALAARGLGQAHLFVMHAHLHDRMVNGGETLQPGQQIGTCGNSGNSSGAHLHLEVRASTDKQARWATIGNTVMDPIVLFNR